MLPIIGIVQFVLPVVFWNSFGFGLGKQLIPARKLDKNTP